MNITDPFNTDYKDFLTIASWAAIRNKTPETIPLVIKAASHLYPHRTEWKEIEGIYSLMYGKDMYKSEYILQNMMEKYPKDTTPCNSIAQDLNVTFLLVQLITWVYKQLTKSILSPISIDRGEKLKQSLEQYLPTENTLIKDMVNSALQYYDNSMKYFKEIKCR